MLGYQVRDPEQPAGLPPNAHALCRGWERMGPFDAQQRLLRLVQLVTSGAPGPDAAANPLLFHPLQLSYAFWEPLHRPLFHLVHHVLTTPGSGIRAIDLQAFLDLVTGTGGLGRDTYFLPYIGRKEWNVPVSWFHPRVGNQYEWVATRSVDFTPPPIGPPATAAPPLSLPPPPPRETPLDPARFGQYGDEGDLMGKACSLVLGPSVDSVLLRSLCQSWLLSIPRNDGERRRDVSIWST